MNTYRWDDGHGHCDTQTATTFAAPRNGWRAEYDAERDEWIVWGPYGGPARRYLRVTR